MTTSPLPITLPVLRVHVEERDGVREFSIVDAAGWSVIVAGELAYAMAAAPELLAALKALHRNVNGDLSGFWTESTSNFMQQAEAAIAKAEGRA